MIIFIDETGFSFQIGTGTTWAPKGRTPVQRRMSKRRQVSTAIGLTITGRVYKKHFDHAIHGEDTVAHLEHLRRQVARAEDHRLGPLAGPPLRSGQSIPAHVRPGTVEVDSRLALATDMLCREAASRTQRRLWTSGGRGR